MPYLDHCIETTWTPVTENYGGGIVRTTHYTSDAELPEWLGENAELQLSPPVGETGGLMIHIKLTGVDSDGRYGFKNKRQGEVVPALRVNGVWSRVYPYQRDFMLYLTESEYDEVFEYDGTDFPEDKPRLLSNRAVWRNVGQEGYDFNFTHGQKTRWGKAADRYSNLQRILAHSATQYDTYLSLRTRQQRWLAQGANSGRDQDRLQQDLERSEAMISQFETQIPQFTLEYANAEATLDKWERGEDPEPHLVELETLKPKLYRLTARLERFERILAEIGPDHDQYKIGQQLIADLKVEIAEIKARIAEVQSGQRQKQKSSGRK